MTQRDFTLSVLSKNRTFELGQPPPDVECGWRLTFALLETETDSLECKTGYPESTIARDQTGAQVGCINVARVRGDRE